MPNDKESGGVVSLKVLDLRAMNGGLDPDEAFKQAIYRKEGFSKEALKCTRGPTFEFWGKLLGEYSTDPQRKRTKWTELRLWQTPSGQWIAESAGCSDEPGHVDIIDAHVIRGPVVLVDRQTLKDFEERTPQTLSMEFQAMEFWGWSSPAKALAKKLGWNLSVQVD